ncbi:MAG: hypothetical protein AABY00_02745 [Nanoarchaeota archaeon]
MTKRFSKKLESLALVGILAYSSLVGKAEQSTNEPSKTQTSSNQATSSYREPLPLKDYSKVQEVFQREGVFATAQNGKPILATFGVGPCVAITGHSKELQRGFIVHYDALTDKDLRTKREHWIPKSLGIAAYWGGHGTTNKVTYDIRIIQGQPETNLLYGIKAFIGQVNSLGHNVQFKIVEEDTNTFSSNAKNIALDVKTGKTFSYNARENLSRGQFDENYELRENLRMIRLQLPTPLDWKIDPILTKGAKE